MIYRFRFDNKDTNTVVEFVKFAKTVDAVRYIKIDWVEKLGVRAGFVDVMCPQKVFEDLFCWLSERRISIKITPMGTLEA